MIKEQAIKTAVKWWSNKLKSKAPHSNGDNSLSSIMACFLADGGMQDVTDEQINIFESELTNYLNHSLDTDTFFGMGCDYNPTANLLEAAKTAGISEFNFPYKTWMEIENRSKSEDGYVVLVSDGYAQPYMELTPME